MGMPKTRHTRDFDMATAGTAKPGLVTHDAALTARMRGPAEAVKMRPDKPAVCRRNGDVRASGLVLVAVLWIIALMIGIVAIAGQTGRLNMKMAMAATDEVRGKWACRAGVENAIAILNEDLRDSDSLSDLWSNNDEAFTNVVMEGCRYSVLVTDEAGKLNVNTATKDQLMALPYMEEHIADAILDWRDTDDDPRPLGAEAGYYENLPIPYTVRNGPFRTIRELLRVKGMTEEHLYGENMNPRGSDASGDSGFSEGWIAYLTCYSYERNVDADGNRRVNINQANQQQLQDQLGISASQARWIVDNRGQGFGSIGDLIEEASPATPPEDGSGNQDQAEPMDLQTFSRIADRIAIVDEDRIPGRININTAPHAVLVALFGRDDQAEQLAHALIGDRSSLLYGFASIGDLLNVQSMSVQRFKAIADLITVRSDVFTIECVATADVSGARFRTECVVDRSQAGGTILYWYQGADY